MESEQSESAPTQSPASPAEYFLAEAMREARQNFTDRLRAARDGSTYEAAIHKVATELCARSREFPANGWWLCEAILATEFATSRTVGYDAVQAEYIRCLSDFYELRSQWSGQADHADLERAVELAELVVIECAPYRHGQDRRDDLEKLSSCTERLYDLTDNEYAMQVSIDSIEKLARISEGTDRGVLLARLRCMKWKRGEKEAVDCPLEVLYADIPKQPVSLDSIEPRRYRFLDCRSFADSKSLRVLEFADLPQGRYVALSYVWRGSSRPESSPEPEATMAIKGAVNADPISIEVLRLACVACLKLGCALLWIDGLCIMQGSDDDKSWQIQRMYDIYRFCKHCLILPGGLSRLVQLDEETSWIHRAWTLQEAIAPDSCHCLFSWVHGDCYLQTISCAQITEVEPGTAAMAKMRQLLDVSLGYSNACRLVFDGKTNDQPAVKIVVRMLANGRKESVVMDALIGAIDMKGKKEGMANAIWRSSIMRTASRPVDSILSIMGLLGVDLDPAEFSSHDRVGATLALMKALLSQGKRAEWLAIAPSLDPGHDLTMLPILPRHSAGGKAYFPTKDGDRVASDLMGELWWWLRDAPTGSMDEEGYLVLTVQAACIRPVHSDDDSHFRDEGKNTWTVVRERGPPPYAVLIGKKEMYLAGAYPTVTDPYNNLAVLVDKKGPGRFRVVGYAGLGEDVLQLPGWEKMTLHIK